MLGDARENQIVPFIYVESGGFCKKKKILYLSVYFWRRRPKTSETLEDDSPKPTLTEQFLFTLFYYLKFIFRYIKILTENQRVNWRMKCHMVLFSKYPYMCRYNPFPGSNGRWHVGLSPATALGAASRVISRIQLLQGNCWGKVVAKNYRRKGFMENIDQTLAGRAGKSLGRKTHGGRSFFFFLESDVDESCWRKVAEGKMLGYISWNDFANCLQKLWSVWS